MPPRENLFHESPSRFRHAFILKSQPRVLENVDFRVFQNLIRSMTQSYLTKNQKSWSLREKGLEVSTSRIAELKNEQIQK